MQMLTPVSILALNDLSSSIYVLVTVSILYYLLIHKMFNINVVYFLKQHLPSLNKAITRHIHQQAPWCLSNSPSSLIQHLYKLLLCLVMIRARQVTARHLRKAVQYNSSKKPLCTKFEYQKEE